MNELQIIAGVKQGNRESQKMLYEQYARKMYSICLRYASDEDSAKDMLQEGFIKVFTNITSFEEKGSFEGWLKRIFINLALESFRKNKSMIHSSDDIHNIPDIVDDATEDNQSDTISETELLNMIQELPKGYSTVFNLYAIEDYSHKEIAQMLEISEGTSRSQYVRARQLLQNRIKEYLNNRG